MTINARGTYEMWTENQVLMCRPLYRWSERTAINYANTMKEKVANFNGANWGSTVLLDQWELGTPEIELIISDLLEWCLQHNLKRLAMVSANNPIQEFQLDKAMKSIAPDFQRYFFPTGQLADEWMLKQGYPRNHQV